MESTTFLRGTNTTENQGKEVEYRGYTIRISNSEGVFYNFQNFENDVLKRAIRFIGGTALYVSSPVLGSAEMVGAVISDVFLEEGYEIVDRIKSVQNKLYNIDYKVDATVVSRCGTSIKYAIQCLKEFQISK